MPLCCEFLYHTAYRNERGWSVITLGRGKPPFPDLLHIPFDLADTAAPRFPTPPDAFIHLACDTTGLNAERLDLPAGHLLASTFANSSTRLVFVSSQTAGHDALTPYGRAKAAVEDVLRPAGAIIIRPGLVYGGRPAGLWGVMTSLVARLPMLPALLPAPLVQPIHLDDLCLALLAAAGGAGQPGQTLAVAAPVPVTITAFLQSIARHAGRRRRLFIPTPTLFLVSAALALSAVLPGLRPRAQQLRSVTRLPLMASAVDLETLGITPRSLISGMRGDVGMRGARLREGALLLRHILQARPPSGALRRYVRATENLGLAPMDESRLHGSRLRLYAPTLNETALAQLSLPADLPLRLHLALVTADASPATAHLFHRMKPHALPFALFDLVGTVIGEAPFLFLRVVRSQIGICR